MDRDTYALLEERFTAIFQPLSCELKSESSDHVRHYVDHGELEMAYESFVLSLIAEQISVPSDFKAELCALGKDLGLDRESVFRADFWESATEFLGCA